MAVSGFRPRRAAVVGAVCALAAVAGMAGTAAAGGAEVVPPNLVGTWKMRGDGHAAARQGGGSTHFDRQTVPTFETPDERWTFVFEVQNGRSFYGSVTGPSGRTTSFVGVFRHDGQNFIVSSQSGIILGEMVGADMEVCFADNVPDWMAVNCAMMTRQKD